MVQGFRIGLIFNPMTVMAFTTLPAALRGYATSLQALWRNIGQAIGVSVTSLMLVRSAQSDACRHRRGDHAVRPGAAEWRGVQQYLSPATRHGAAMLDQMIKHQAQIIAYNNDFRMMALLSCRRCCCCW